MLNYGLSIGVSVVESRKKLAITVNALFVVSVKDLEMLAKIIAANKSVLPIVIVA